MKRSNFLKACLTVGTLIAAPFHLLAETVRKYRVEKGFIVNAGKDRFDKSISLFGWWPNCVEIDIFVHGFRSRCL